MIKLNPPTDPAAARRFAVTERDLGHGLEIRRHAACGIGLEPVTLGPRGTHAAAYNTRRHICAVSRAFCDGPHDDLYGSTPHLDTIQNATALAQRGGLRRVQQATMAVTSCRRRGASPANVRPRTSSARRGLHAAPPGHGQPPVHCGAHPLCHATMRRCRHRTTLRLGSIPAVPMLDCARAAIDGRDGAAVLVLPCSQRPPQVTACRCPPWRIATSRRVVT